MSTDVRLCQDENRIRIKWSARQKHQTDSTNDYNDEYSGYRFLFTFDYALKMGCLPSINPAKDRIQIETRYHALSERTCILAPGPMFLQPFYGDARGPSPICYIS